MDEYVQKKIDEALAARDQKQAEQVAATAATVNKPVDQGIKPTEAKAPEAPDNLFGNADKKKEFNLSKLLPGLKELPDDRYIIVQQSFRSNADGSADEDKTARKAQIITPEVYEVNAAKKDGQGKSIYEALLGNYSVVHKPKN